MIPPFGLAACYEGDIDGEWWGRSESVVWITPGQAELPFEAWVLNEENQPVRADSLDGFSGFEWRMPVVAAVPGAGWSVDRQGERETVLAWVVRGDGRVMPAVAGPFRARTLDPAYDDFELVGPAALDPDSDEFDHIPPAGSRDQ